MTKKSKNTHLRQHILEKYKTRKNINKKQHDSNKHSYFIVQCKYSNVSGLNNTYLEEHLAKLNVLPDKNFRKYESDVKKMIEKQHIQYKDFCELTKKAKLPTINYKIHADVFIYHQGSMFLNKPFYNYPKFLLNMLDINYMKTINKAVIYKNVYKIDQKLAEHYFIETFQINELEKYNFMEYYILRPKDSFGGKDILYINNKINLYKAINFYKNKKNYRGLIYGNNVIASKFITNLLLFNGKKFNLRMYYVVSLTNNVFNSFLLKYSDISVAKSLYHLKKPYTMDVHNTGHDTENDNYKIERKYFPNDFTFLHLGIDIDENKVNTIYNKCKIICSCISKVLYNKSKKTSLLYSHQTNGYYLFGLDIMIRDNLEPILIECNKQPGMESYTENECNSFSKNYYQWINDTILEPLFKYNDPFKAREHPTYIHI